MPGILRPSLRAAVAAAAAAAAAAFPAAAASAPAAAPIANSPSQLTVAGAIATYHLSGPAVRVVARMDSGCRGFRWAPGATSPTAHVVASASCADAHTLAQAKLLAHASVGRVPASVVSGRVRVAVQAGTVDSPTVLVVSDRSSGRVLHRWPLPDAVSSLGVGHGIAVLATTQHQGLYAVRLRDGRLRIIGLMGWNDTPSLGASGVVFRDDMYGRRNARQGTTVLRYLTWKEIDQAIAGASASYSAPHARAAWAYDGQRVGMAISDPQVPCDRVHFWNVAWDRRVKLTMPDDHVCPGGKGSHVTALALGGVRAAWLVSKPGAGRWLISATIVACEEHVVATAPAGSEGAGATGLVGDGGLVAFSAVGAPGVHSIVRDRASSDRTAVTWRELNPLRGALALSADNRRVAVLSTDGWIEIRSKLGAVDHVLHAPGARAISLRGGTLATLAGGHLDVYDVDSGLRTQHWPVPAGARGVDMHFGVATFAAGRTVYAVRIATGRTVTLAVAPGRVEAQIEAPGVVYRYDQAGRGEFRFMSLAKVQNALAA